MRDSEQFITTRENTQKQLLRKTARIASQLDTLVILALVVESPVYRSAHVYCSLDPSVNLAFGTFPPADAIYIWKRDPPEASSIPYCGYPLLLLPLRKENLGNVFRIGFNSQTG